MRRPVCHSLEKELVTAGQLRKSGRSSACITLIPMRHLAIVGRRLLSAMMGGVSLAAVLVTPAARAETTAPEGGPPPFSCKAASIVTVSEALPRNVPAVPIGPSSLLKVSDLRVDIIGASSTIGSAVRSDDWTPFMGDTWLVSPSTPPEVGNVHFRFEEVCARTDGGGYESRPHQVNLAFRFTEAAPLPTVAGTVVVNQSPAGYLPAVRVWTDGVCELRRFGSIKVTVDWSPAPELLPFGEAVLARGGWRKEFRTLWKGYGESLSGAAPYQADIGVVSCNPMTNADSGFVDGRGSFTLLAKLAGAEELQAVNTDVQLECPPTELLGPCSDAGPDVAIDAPAIDAPGTAIDAPVMAIDVADVRDSGAEDSSDASTDAPMVDAFSSTDAGLPNPPVFIANDTGSACSIRSVAPARAAPSDAWLLGFLLTAVSALRRRRAE